MTLTQAQRLHTCKSDLQLTLQMLDKSFRVDHTDVITCATQTGTSTALLRPSCMADSRLPINKEKTHRSKDGLCKVHSHQRHIDHPKTIATSPIDVPSDFWLFVNTKLNHISIRDSRGTRKQHHASHLEKKAWTTYGYPNRYWLVLLLQDSSCDVTDWHS